MIKSHITTKSLLRTLFLSGCILSLSPLFGYHPDNPNSKEFQANAKANRTRIEAALKENNQTADLVHFTVFPMSDIMRLGDVYPEDGRLNGSIRIVLAQDEYEPGSFQLFSFKDRKNVTFTVSDLKSKDGAVLPAKNLDLKVVKIWYQNGNRWHSYFQDIGLRLTPELLLNDENLVKVDTKEVANYARIKTDKGERFEWISAPIEIDQSYDYARFSAFDPFQEGFEDAKTLQPVILEANQFKQFFLTVHAEKGRKPGVYTGSIAVNENGRKVSEIPVAVRVLPFELPLPMAWQDLERPFLASMMDGFNYGRINSYDHSLTWDKYREILLNGKRHNLLYPHVEANKETLDLLKEIGLPLNPHLGGGLGGGGFIGTWFGHGNRLTFDQHMAAKRGAEKARDFYTENLGHTNVYFSWGDEAGAVFAVAMRDFYKYFEQYGMHIGIAGHDHMFYKSGYAYGWHMMGGQPEAIHRIKPWNDLGAYVSFYAGQHTASENPQFMRRQHGLHGYLNGLNMTFNYEFAHGPWNDLANPLYRPMVIAYLNRGGLVDTLQWEGFREAIDDIRYATKLQQLAQEAISSGDIERKLEAKRALQYITLLDSSSMDLNTVRGEMIEYILNLIKLAATATK